MNPDTIISVAAGEASAAHDEARTRQFLTAIAQGLGIAPATLVHVRFTGAGDLPSVYAVTDLAAAAIAAAGAAMAELVAARSGSLPHVTVDRRLASLWFRRSINPQGWTLPGEWDAIAGDYATADGWIRIHTNAPHHRAAALAVLGVAADKSTVARAILDWNADALETAIVGNHGCAATMRPAAAWAQHAQGASVAREPLVATRTTGDCSDAKLPATPERPLQGVRVLDLTRVLAGPVATRFLAGFGADVLRIDPPVWEELGLAPEVTLGKRCARLDLRNPREHAVFLDLLRQADVFVHGYRADALDKLGLDATALRAINPGMIDVAHNAYGWSGPWRNRRGFDSLVQMSSGIADAGMRILGAERPAPLPVQAVDHATGYLLAAAVVRGLTLRLATAQGYEARASLARTAQLLISGPAGRADGKLAPAAGKDWSDGVEATDFGPALRLRPPLTIGAAPMHWDRPAAALGSSAPGW